MAQYCFCGCGQRVRFTKKRLSNLGATAQRTLGTLKSATLPLVEGNAVAEERVWRLIEEGEDIRNLYAELVHGTVLAPPVNLQARILEWERDAARVADESLHHAGRSEGQSLGHARGAPADGPVSHGGSQPQDIDDRTRRWFNQAIEYYNQPVCFDIARLHSLYLSASLDENRRGTLHDEDWSADEIADLVANVARFGYAFRLYEEHAFRITEPDHVSEIAMRELVEKNPTADVGALVLASCMNIAWAAARAGHDPFATIATREGPSNDARSLIALASVEAAIDLGFQEKLRQPQNVSDELLLGAWRFGFGTRLCEAALPPGVTLSTQAGERRG